MKSCAACGNPITKEQYLYEVKLDNGKIVYSHSYPCLEKHHIDRPKPILLPDWWVRQVPNVESEMTEVLWDGKPLKRLEIHETESGLVWFRGTFMDDTYRDSLYLKGTI